MNLEVRFQENNRSFKPVFGEVHTVTEYVGGELYNGSYTITPGIWEQKMATRSKIMTDDVTVKAIPYYEVSNPSGGNTVFIGAEI